MYYSTLLPNTHAKSFMMYDSLQCYGYSNIIHWFPSQSVYPHIPGYVLHSLTYTCTFLSLHSHPSFTRFTTHSSTSPRVQHTSISTRDTSISTTFPPSLYAIPWTSYRRPLPQPTLHLLLHRTDLLFHSLDTPTASPPLTSS